MSIMQQKKVRLIPFTFSYETFANCSSKRPTCIHPYLLPLAGSFIQEALGCRGRRGVVIIQVCNKDIPRRPHLNRSTTKCQSGGF